MRCSYYEQILCAINFKLTSSFRSNDSSYPVDYRTEQNFKGTEIEKQKLDNLLLIAAKSIGIKLFLNREIPEVLVLPWNTLEDELKKQKN